MKSSCLLLVVLCSAFVLQNVSANKLRAKWGTNWTPSDYNMQITTYSGVSAKDVGVGADGTIWIVTTTASGSDYTIQRLAPGSDSWETISGAAAQYISVANDGNAWIVKSNGNILKYTGSSWQSVSGTAYEISCSPDGNVFHIGSSNGLYMLNRAGNGWNKLDGAAVKIAGGQSQSVWHLNSGKNIYRSMPFTWEQAPGSATDIAVGANGLVWILNTNSFPNQYSVFDSIRQAWIQAPIDDYLAKNPSVSFSNSSGQRVAVAPNGDLLGVKANGELFRIRFNWGDN